MENTTVEWRPLHFRNVLAHERRVRFVPAKFDQFLLGRAGPSSRRRSFWLSRCLRNKLQRNQTKAERAGEQAHKSIDTCSGDVIQIADAARTSNRTIDATASR